MNYVEVDARRLTKALAIAIVSRAMSVSSGKPVVITFDDETVRDHVASYTGSKRWKSEMKDLPEGLFSLTIHK